jgi:nitroreductase
MRKGISADSRMPAEKIFFDGAWDRGLPASKQATIADLIEMVRWAPSAVNKQPWRVVICGDKAHFYEKRSRGYVSANGWDIQKIDMGIALSHFELAAKECGISAAFEICDPGLETPENTSYIATYTIA